MEPITPALVMTGWADGWSHSRQTPPPQQQRALLRIQVDAPQESVRWLLPRPTRALLADLLRQEHPVHTGVKVMGEPEVWAGRFGPGWVDDVEVWLMRRDLELRTVPALPRGYRVERVDAEHRVVVQIWSPEDEPAARGQLGLGETWAVPDRIATEPAHQRKGLGSVVMSTLENAALEHGLSRAVLGASAEGRALYRHLGWLEVGRRTGKYYRPDET